MSNPAFAFDHVHLIRPAPKAAAEWYVEMFGAVIKRESETRGAPQIFVEIGGMTVIIRGQRPGEEPSDPKPVTQYKDYSSHNEWGTDHFGFSVAGDLRALCAELKAKGAEPAVEPYEFLPGRTIAYLKAPDGVTVELTEAD